MVSRSIFLIPEMKVVFHRTARVSSFLILAWCGNRCHIPKGNQNGDKGPDGKEYPGQDASTDSTSEIGGHANHKCEEQEVRELLIAGGICR